jgi:hypothetical protein
MAHSNNPPKTLSEVIDELERIQGELLSLQRSLEKMEPVEALVSSAATPED